MGIPFSQNHHWTSRRCSRELESIKLSSARRRVEAIHVDAEAESETERELRETIGELMKRRQRRNLETMMSKMKNLKSMRSRFKIGPRRQQPYQVRSRRHSTSCPWRFRNHRIQRPQTNLSRCISNHPCWRHKPKVIRHPRFRSRSLRSRIRGWVTSLRKYKTRFRSSWMC